MMNRRGRGSEAGTSRGRKRGGDDDPAAGGLTHQPARHRGEDVVGAAARLPRRFRSCSRRREAPRGVRACAMGGWGGGARGEPRGSVRYGRPLTEDIRAVGPEGEGHPPAHLRQELAVDEIVHPLVPPRRVHRDRRRGAERELTPAPIAASETKNERGVVVSQRSGNEKSSRGGRRKVEGSETPVGITPAFRSRHASRYEKKLSSSSAEHVLRSLVRTSHPALVSRSRSSPRPPPSPTPSLAPGFATPRP